MSIAIGGISVPDSKPEEGCSIVRMYVSTAAQEAVHVDR